MKNKITLKRIKCIAVVIGVIIIPLMYSYFYLGAFWDPYSKLETLPVAVVNNDKGAEINGAQRNVGQEMCKKFEESGSLKFVFTDEEDATSGTKGKEYYAMIVIPEDFSSDIASAGTTDKHTATLTYSPNEKRNYLASQILSRAVVQIEESVRSSVNEELVQQLADKLNAVPDQMTVLQDGMAKLDDGSAQVSAGAATLASGTAEFNSKFKEYQAGVAKVQSGADTLNSGIGTLDSGVNDLLNGINKITDKTKDLGQITAGAQALAAKSEEFNSSLIAFTGGVDTLIAGVQKSSKDTSDLMTYLMAKYGTQLGTDTTVTDALTKMGTQKDATATQLATLSGYNTALKAASAKITAATKQLSDGTAGLPELKDGLQLLSAGISDAKAGTTKLVAGSQLVDNGVNALGDATGKLGTAAGTIANGAATLSTGAATLDAGVGTAKAGVDTSITDANGQLKSLDGLSDFAAAPVTVSQSNITSVPNYGTAFAPYFMSLSLWVGGLIIFVAIYYDPDEKFKILSRDTDNRVARSFIYLLIGFVQAVALGILLKIGLGLEVDNYPLYFLSVSLVSLVFLSMIQFFMVFLKDLGKLICMVMLILQLTSCGGTFPMELLSKFFNVLYPWMPMTYSVGLFKQAISGVNTSDVMYNGGILFGILIVFMTLTVICSTAKAKREESLQEVYKEAM